MKVTIATIMYQRLDVFEIYAKGVKTLINTFKDIDFKVVVVGSCKEDEQACDKHGFTFYNYPNKPLGAKAQFRLAMAKRTNADYYLFLGSDDIMTPKAFEYCLTYMNKGYEHIAPYDIFYSYCSSFYYSQGYPLGHERYLEPLAVGRLLSKGFLNRIGWKLWSESIINRGLDSKANKIIKEAEPLSHYYFSMDTGGFIVDFKTNNNLTFFKRHNYKLLGKTKDYINYE